MRPVFYDLHIHSCLSPCGDQDMTPNNIVNMALLKELELIALTDHNSCKNCPAIMKAAAGTGLVVLPGMELTTAEEAPLSTNAWRLSKTRRTSLANSLSWIKMTIRSVTRTFCSSMRPRSVSMKRLRP